MVRRMTTLYLILLIASAACLAMSAFAEKRATRGINLLALGLLLFVLVFLIQAVEAL